MCCGQVSSALCGQMQPGARRLEMFPALPGTSIQGTVPFPFGKDNEGSSLPPPGPPDVAACADRPCCFSAPETLLCSIPARGDWFGQSISKKGPRKAGREGKGFPKSQRPHPGTLSGCFPSRGCVGAGCSPGRTSPDGAGGPRTKQAPLAVRLAFCIPTVLVTQRAKTPALTLPGVRGWCKRMMKRMMKDPATAGSCPCVHGAAGKTWGQRRGARALGAEGITACRPILGRMPGAGGGGILSTQNLRH